MRDKDSKKELMELIKYYQEIIYNYKRFSNYRNHMITLDEAERWLEKYKRLYCETLK